MYIKQITLKNIKSFKDVTFDFTRPDGSFAGWTVFVGGNGSGKTTVLRAIAQTLMGPDAGQILLGLYRGWITDGESDGATTATIVADPKFDKDSTVRTVMVPNLKSVKSVPPDLEAGICWSQEIHVKSTSRGGHVKLSALTPSTELEHGLWQRHPNGWFATGYGPMRRLTGSTEEALMLAENDTRIGRHSTLFLESAALSEGEAWLRRIHARYLEAINRDSKNSDNCAACEELEGLLDYAKALLNDGLLPRGVRISRVTVDRIFATDSQGVEVPLEDLSDGCRSVVALVLDILLKLSNASDIYPLPTHREGDSVVVAHNGIVLIDEAEAHLHPAWQRDLPEWFKKHFPNIQFIVTTHSPLIAQAADPNGLFILPGQGDIDSQPRQASPSEYERVRLGAAFKTVLGVAFGLDSTRSRWASEQIARWELLDAKRRAGALTREEVGEHELLRGRMRIAFPEISSFADM